jgi:hypothetical protein
VRADVLQTKHVQVASTVDGLSTTLGGVCRQLKVLEHSAQIGLTQVERGL